MAVPHGKDAHFELAGNDLSTFCDSIEISNSAETAETSTMGTEAKTFLAGLTDATLSIGGKWDGQASEVQTLTASGTVSGGTYTLGFDGQTTSALAHAATNATILAALNALSNVASGDIVLTGGGLPTTPVVFTFALAYLGEDVPLLVVTNSLTGGGSYVASETTKVGPDATIAPLVGAETASTWVYGPEGSGSGDVKYSGSAFITAYNCTAPIGDVVAWTGDLQVTGAVARGAFT